MGGCGTENSGVSAIAVPPGALAVLPGTDWADCYRVEVAGERAAPELFDTLFATAPPWFGMLMRLRDRVMAPFGVKAAGNAPFPVVSSDPARVVVGFDDSHLDFRLLGQAAPAGNGRTMFTVTTLVRFNKPLGRVYLRVVLPFHRLISRVMMANLARQPPNP